MFTFAQQLTPMIKEPPLQSLVEDDDLALKEVYLEYREPFINYARKFSLDDDDILDIYQDSIIAMRENFIEGNVTELTSSIKTYLFGIGKYKIYAHLRKNNKTKVLEEQHLPENEEEGFNFEMSENPLTEKQEILKKALEKMGGRCRNILELFYYRGMSIDEIRDSEGYENNNTVKSQKSRCLKSLKEMILNP